MKLDKLALRYLPIASLNPATRNPRTHSQAQIQLIADAIERFGFTNPILVDRDMSIVAGHGRLEAAKLLGLDAVPTIAIENLTPAEIRALAIADNKLAEKAGWDQDLLALELSDISELDASLDLELTGFETPEIDFLLSSTISDEPEPEQLVRLEPSGPVISRLGDLWQLGNHRLLCGDATDLDSFEQLMGDTRAQLVFIDPPYNVPIDGHVCGSGSIKHREFAMASGEMTPDQFIAFLTTSFHHLTNYSTDGSIHYICMDWRHMEELLTAGKAAYTELKNLCVWNKTNGGMGSLYRSKHELIFVYKFGTAPHINNVELGKHGRYRTNVWDHPGVNTVGDGRLKELAMHPTVKPVKMIAEALLDCSYRGDVILDCFGGSGSTLIAAEQTGRHARVMELDPAYVDVIIRRFSETTNNTVTHLPTGSSFEEITAARAEPQSEEKSEEGISHE